MNDLDRMKELIHTLNEAGKAYYQQNKEVIIKYYTSKHFDTKIIISNRKILYMVFYH